MNTFLTIEWLFSRAVVERLGWALVHSLWQFALVASLAGVAVRALRRSSSSLRYVVLVTAMAVLVAAPVATWKFTASDVPAPVASAVALAPESDSNDTMPPGADATRLAGDAMLASDAMIEFPALDRAAVSNDAQSQLAMLPPTTAIIQPNVSWSARAKAVMRPWLAWIVVFWSLGVVVCSARPLLGWYTLRRLKCVGVTPISDEVLVTLRRVSKQLGLRGAVQLLQSSLAKVPVVVGYFRPVILLPVSLATSIPASQLEAILAHELAHVQRHDFAVNLLQTLVETLFFYHPAVWWLSHQIRVEREYCCDDLVVNLLGNRVEYGRALVAVELLRGRSSALALGAGDGSLLSRIRRLAHGPVTESRRAAWCGSLVTILVFAVGCTMLVSSRLDALAPADSCRVVLPDGSTVALLGITSDATDPARWWHANGEPLESHPLTGLTTTSQPNWGERRRFAVRSTGAQRVVWVFPGDGQYESSGSEAGRPGDRREAVIAPLALPSLDPMTVTCGIGDGDFGPWARVGRDGTREPVPDVPTELAPDYERLSPIRVESDAGNVKLVLPPYDFNVDRFIADREWVVIATDGQRLSAARSDYASGPVQITFSLPADSVDHFEFRLRPYRHWVMFGNVSLRRGQKTDVKVSVATVPVEQPAGATVAVKPKLGITGRVVDAETGKVIDKIRMVPTSVTSDDVKNITWQTQYLKDFTDGRFLYETDRPWDKTRLRIEAEGYRPAITRVVNKGEIVELEIKLERKTLAGIVRLPNGQPAAKAQVALASWTNEIKLASVKLAYSGHGEKLRQVVETDEQGRFVLPAEVDPSVVVVAHEAGYAEVANAETSLIPNALPASDVPGDKPQFETRIIELQPWGRVEGRVLMGDKPVVGGKYWVYQSRADDVHVWASNNIQTDAEGRFVVERLPPGQYGTCQRYAESSDGKSSFAIDGLLVRFDVPSGKTTTLALGSPGRTLIGKLAPPEGFPHKIDWTKVKLNVSLKGPHWNRFGESGEQATQWSKFLQTDEGKLYSRANVAIAGDGSFRIDGLPAAEYDLSVSALGEAVIGDSKPAGPILSGSKSLSVPGVASPDKVEAIDLGPIDLKSLVALTDERTWGRGEAQNGLRARVVPVLSSMRDDAINPTQRVTKFAKADDVAFVVELENVSDKPIKLVDVFHDAKTGEPIPNSDLWSQFVFSVDLIDRDGKLIEQPEIEIDDAIFFLHDARVVILEPGKTQQFLVKIVRWLAAFKPRIQPGSYRAAVRYRWLSSPNAARTIRKNSPLLDVAAVNVVSAGVKIEVGGESRKADLVWGERVNGLRAAVSFEPSKMSYSHGETFDVTLHLQNVGPQPLKLISDLSRPAVGMTIKNDKGQPVDLDDSLVDGRMSTGMRGLLTLKSQQVAVLDVGPLGLAITEERANQFDDATERRLVAPAGKYSMQLNALFNNVLNARWIPGQTSIDVKGAWVGELKTIETPLTITNEIIECDIVDAITGQLISDTTTTFLFIKPKSATSEETTVANMVWGPKGPGHIYFTIPTIPEDIAQRADRDELEVRWGTGNNPDYENHSPTERIPLKPFFHEGPKAARDALGRIKLTPKRKSETSRPAPFASLNVKYEMPGAEAETRIFVERMDKEFQAKHGRRDEYGKDEYGGVRFSRLMNGDSLTLGDLPAGKYLVARYRLVDIVREGTGKAQSNVLLDRQWIELAERETKSIRVTRPAGHPISGRVVIPADLKVNTLVVHVCGENARSSGSLNHPDVMYFDALNADSNGKFKTEPLPPGRYKVIVEGYANHSLALSGIIVPSWEGTARVTVAESNEPAAIEVTLREFDREAWLKDQTAAANELEFLKPYPKLQSLSLDMTEPQFLEIVKQQELKTRKTVEGEKVTHHIALGDGHTLIVMFDKDAKCGGIQRVRGEDADRVNATERTDTPKRSPNPLVTVLLPAPPKAVLDAAGAVMPIGMEQRLGSTRFKVPGWWRRLAFAGNDEWVWLKADERVSVIHRETGHVVKHQQLRLGEGSARVLTVSPDGTRVAIGMFQLPNDADGQTNYRVVLMSALTTAHLQELKWKGLPSELNCLSFSGDGKLLLTGTHLGDVRLWDVETGKLLQQQQIDGIDHVRHSALSPDGRVAVLTGLRGSRLWKITEKGAPIVLDAKRSDSVCFAPNGRVFAIVSRDGVRIRNAATGEVIAHLKTPGIDNYSDADFGIDFSPDSKMLAVPAMSSDLVELWDVEAKQRVATLPVHQPRGVAISRDGRWLAVSGQDSATVIFDLKTRRQVNLPGDGHSQEVLGVRFAANDSLVSSSYGEARVWDMKSGKQQRTMAHENSATTVRGLAVSPDGATIATSAHDNTLGVWDRATGKRLFTLQGHGLYGGSRAVRFKADGSQFVSWGDDAVLRWWNAKDGSLVAAHPLEVPGYTYEADGKNAFALSGLCAAFAPDTKSLFVVYGETLSEFDTGTGKRLRQVPIPPRTKPLAVSADGRWLAAGESRRDEQGNNTSTAIVLRDRATLKVVREWRVSDPREAVANADPGRKPSISYISENDNGIAFSPDSRFLAWSRIDAHPGLDIADVEHDRLRGSIPVESVCWCLDFSFDGKQLATGHADSTVSVWDLRNPAFAVAEARGLEILKPYPKPRGEDAEDEPAAARQIRSPRIVLPDHLNVMAVGFDRDGEDLVTVATEKDVAVRVWDLAEKKLKREVKLETDKHGNFFLQSHLTLSGDRQRVVAILDGKVTIWESASGKLIKTLTLPKDMEHGFLRCLACTPDLSVVAIGRTPGFGGFGIPDAHAIVWDVVSGRVLRTVTHVSAVQVQSVALSPDGKYLATGGQQAGMCLWDVGTGKLLHQLPNDNPGRKHPDPEVSESGANQVLCLRFSPDSQQLALGDMLGVKLVDVKSGEMLHQFDAPFRFGRSGLVFSRDGLQLARTATDKLVPIWSTKTGKLLVELPTEAHDGSFSDDGRSFAVGFSHDKQAAAVWQLGDPDR